MPGGPLTFDGEVHGLADVGAHVVADFAQVEAAVVLQDVLDEQRAVAEQLHAGAAVERDGLELGDAGAWSDQRGATERRGRESVSVAVCACVCVFICACLQI